MNNLNFYKAVAKLETATTIDTILHLIKISVDMEEFQQKQFENLAIKKMDCMIQSLEN